MTQPAVLIIGAGPTGLMMACQLAIRHIPFRILDKNENHTTQSRALVVQARSVEIFDQMGIAQEALRLGEIAQAVNLFVNGKRAFHLDVGNIGAGLTAYPFLLMLEQSNTEKLLNDFLASYGQAVERRTELVDFVQDADGVSATIRQADGREEVIQAEWLVGADGAHSVVREKLNIPFAGKTYQQSLFVLDCEASLDLPHNEMSIVFSDQAFTGFFPLTNGRYRVLGTVPEALEGQETITFAEVSRDIDKRIHMNVSLHNPAWIALYHSHHRVVSTFRKGRSFLAGDAAHIHSPVGAQGMNTGLQDAYNLAWKLALVVQRMARESLLDTYQEERLSIAQSLVRTTDRAFYYVNSQNPVLKTLRLQVMPLAMKVLVPLVEKVRFIRELGFKSISEIGIAYRESRLSQEDSQPQFPNHAPQPGDRMPYIKFQDADGKEKNIQEKLRDSAFHLFLFPGTTGTTMLEELLSVVARHKELIVVETLPLTPETKHLYEAFGIKDCGYYFVRPDLYIAYRSTKFDAANFENYLSHFLTK